MREGSDENRVLRFLDRGSWKHSWHLPQRYGGFDWIDQKAIDRVTEEVAQAREQALGLLNEAAFAEEWAKACQQRADEENAVLSEPDDA